ncbi:MAG: hypothetical protein IPN76_26140 [Saprospiraceae bacterium]|nr:hypothetical protein [Saprospiraceae bacterium]
MKHINKHPLHTYPAHLWDGHRQLPGQLELWEHELVFRFANFEDSHLQLAVPLSEITNLEEFLIYNVAWNGLRVISTDGKADSFVLEQSRLFKHLLEAQISRKS